MNEVETSPSTHEPSPAPESWLPDWSPWAVLGGLLSLGLLGGIGLIPLRVPQLAATTAREVSTTQAEPANKGPRVTLRGTSASSAAPVPDPGSSPAAASGDAKIAVSHLVVSHKDSPLGKHHKIARTKEEAKRRAEGALVRARKGEDFGKLVVEFSDEPGAAERKGNLGKFRHKDAIKPFADAAFHLKPGEVSGIVETSFGYHVIRRTE
jgi:hypothetical protein